MHLTLLIFSHIFSFEEKIIIIIEGKLDHHLMIHSDFYVMVKKKNLCNASLCLNGLYSSLKFFFYFKLIESQCD